MIDIKQYLDGSNIGLWQTMSQSFHINIDYCSEDYYGNYYRNNDCTIYVPKNGIPNTASFTHELLHLLLPSHKIYIGGAVECKLREIFPLNTIFDKDLYDHISNCLGHVKMLPRYLKMGYPIEEFLSDYHEKKLTKNGLFGLSLLCKKNCLNRKYNRMAYNAYIGKFFAAKADINPDNHYDELLNGLKKIDSKLFLALETFWNGWVDYDIEKKREVWEDDYHVLVDVLTDDLINWCKHKEFV